MTKQAVTLSEALAGSPGSTTRTAKVIAVDNGTAYVVPVGGNIGFYVDVGGSVSAGDIVTLQRINHQRIVVGPSGASGSISSSTSVQSSGSSLVSMDWSLITGKPSTFSPSTHSHNWADVVGKPSTFSPTAHAASHAADGSDPITVEVADGSIDYLKLAAMTSAQFAGVISDETGSGALVFGTSPTIADPVIANVSPVADFTLTQNSIIPFTSVAASAAANTLVLKAGRAGFGTATPAQAVDIVGKIAINGVQTVYNAGALGEFTGTLIIGNGGTNLLHTTESEGYYNTFVGHSSGAANTIGRSNMGVGAYTLAANTSGSNNVANGSSTLRWNTTGGNNIAIGYSTLYDLISGSSNVAIGVSTGRGILTGSGNTILGTGITGLAEDLTNNIILASGSTARATFDGADWAFTGKVGIGVTPTAKLSLVAATTAAGGIDFGGDVSLYRSAANILTTDDNVTLAGNVAIGGGTFASGWAGAGWRTDYGVTAANRSSAEVDDLTVRGRMRVYELLINQIRATNGSLFVSSSGKVKSVTGTNPYAIVSDDVHGFLVDDIIRAQRFTGSAGAYASDMHVTVVTSTTNFTAVLDAGTAPVAGHEYVRLGSSSDATRQGGIYLTADDGNAPYLDVVDGVTSRTNWNDFSKVKVRIGKLSGITDAKFGVLSGYGMWAGNAYLTGAIKATSGELVNLDISGLLKMEGGSSAIAIGATAPTRYDAGDGIWIDKSGIFAIASGAWKFKVDATTGAMNAKSGSVGGWTMGAAALSSSGGITLAASSTPASNKIYIGTGAYGNANTSFYVDGAGYFSLKDKLTWDGTTLTVNGGGTFSGALSAASGTFAGSLTAASGVISGLLKMEGASSAIAIGATAPVDSSHGTGIWIDKTGLYGLDTDVLQTKIDSTGKLVAGGGAVTIDANGISVITSDITLQDLSSYKILGYSNETISRFSSYYRSGGIVTVLETLPQPDAGSSLSLRSWADDQIAYASLSANCGVDDAWISVTADPTEGLSAYISCDTSIDGNVLVTGKNDAVQLTVKGNGTQTASLQEWQKSDGTPISMITGTGMFMTSGVGASMNMYDAYTLGATSGATFFAGVSSLPTAADQRMAVFGTQAWTGSSNMRPSVISFWASEGFTSGSKSGSHIRFETTPIGSTTRSERMRIKDNGDVSIGSSTALLTLNGSQVRASTQANTPATTGTMTIGMGAIKVYRITPTGNCTFNATGGYAGDICTFVITTTTTARTLTWGTYFKTQATVSTGTTANKTITVSFICTDDTIWAEVGRVGAMA